jgi:hypothetical protein
MPRHRTKKRILWLEIILSLLSGTEIGALLVVIFGAAYLVAKSSDKSEQPPRSDLAVNL